MSFNSLARSRRRRERTISTSDASKDEGACTRLASSVLTLAHAIFLPSTFHATKHVCTFGRSLCNKLSKLMKSRVRREAANPWCIPQRRVKLICYALSTTPQPVARLQSVSHCLIQCRRAGKDDCHNDNSINCTSLE